MSFLEQPRRTEMAAPEEGSTTISARRVDKMETAGKIGGTEYAEVAQWSRRIEEKEPDSQIEGGQEAERRIRWQRGGLGLRTGAERRRLRRKRGGKDDEDRQARQPGPEKRNEKRGRHDHQAAAAKGQSKSQF